MVYCIYNCPNGMFRLVKGLSINDEEVEGGRCMRGSDGRKWLNLGKIIGSKS